jgi:hypothetical protein
VDNLRLFEPSLLDGEEEECGFHLVENFALNALEEL